MAGTPAVRIGIPRATAVICQLLIVLWQSELQTETRKLGKLTTELIFLHDVKRRPCLAVAVGDRTESCCDNYAASCVFVLLYPDDTAVTIELLFQNAHLRRVEAVFLPVLGKPVAERLVVVGRSAEQ